MPEPDSTELPAPTPHTEPAEVARDPWVALTRFTSARIAQGRAGGSQRTASRLAFQLAHARAIDAVHTPFDAPALAADLHVLGEETHLLTSAATNRAAYLTRPDLGRRLADASRKALNDARAAWGPRDLAILVSDGLSAQAAQRHAVPTLQALLPFLRAAGWTLWPIFVVPFARVKLQDELGERLGARHALILLGERPGLGSPDSLGAYFTYQPRGDRTDADRNCVSNIRPGGLMPTDAGQKLATLLQASAALQLSGVHLKDTSRLR